MKAEIEKLEKRICHLQSLGFVRLLTDAEKIELAILENQLAELEA